MFKIYEDTIVYVLSPAFGNTGGVELAHQLVKEINDNGGKAYITYYTSMLNRKNIRIMDGYLKYVDDFKVINDIQDNEHNIVVIPEVRPDFITRFKHIQKSIWFMSVDNFVTRNDLTKFYNSYGCIKTIKNLIVGQIKVNGFWKYLNENVVKFYQSQYAFNFLIDHGVKDCYRLSDYINDIYLENDVDIISRKEDIVLYNPKKGFSFTKKVIKELSDYECIPIENMTPQEVRTLLRRSKVYIDFGNHPGKDRFPREAAASMCCIITGKNGSAKYYEDIMIEDKYKFEDKETNVDSIVSEIKECLDNYQIRILDFEKYRQSIQREKEVFKSDVRKYFLA